MIVIVAVCYCAIAAVSWRWIIRWGIEDYKRSYLYPQYWDWKQVFLLSVLALDWPSGLVLAYVFIKPHRPRPLREEPSRLERFVGIKPESEGQ